MIRDNDGDGDIDAAVFDTDGDGNYDTRHLDLDKDGARDTVDGDGQLTTEQQNLSDRALRRPGIRRHPGRGTGR
ncbi:hypothetical protein QP028_10795 [Corynebacterium suedekumii]|nr:hypothetical protein QP028_10795 [Corynebacterium suedekumii]